MDEQIEYYVDLFSGAGGTISGILEAIEMIESMNLNNNVKKFVAINHWDLAIKTNQVNHPNVICMNSDLERVNPKSVIVNGYVRLLTASPECTFFSRALGGKPVEKQSRASAKYVLKWIHQVYIEDLWIENVPEFKEWGPIHRTCTCGIGVHIEAKLHDRKCHFEKPIKKRKGEYFLRFVKKIEEAGYLIDWRVLNAANYGDATTRERLIIQARKNLPIRWPQPTHSQHPINMFDTFEKWRTAEDIIDFRIKGVSIYKKKLSDKTIKKIWQGFMKYGGKKFIIGQHSGAAPRTTKYPVPTIAGAGAIHFVEPFILKMDNGGGIRSVKKPMFTLTSTEAFAIIEPFLIEYYGTGGASDLKRPFKTITGNDHFALVEPVIVKIGKKKYKLDFLHRMLRIKELALATSFKEEYKFYGTKKEQVKQIGNAVPVRLSRAVSYALISDKVYSKDVKGFGNHFGTKGVIGRLSCARYK